MASSIGPSKCANKMHFASKIYRMIKLLSHFRRNSHQNILISLSMVWIVSFHTPMECIWIRKRFVSSLEQPLPMKVFLFLLLLLHTLFSLFHGMCNCVQCIFNRDVLCMVRVMAIAHTHTHTHLNATDQETSLSVKESNMGGLCESVF